MVRIIYRIDDRLIHGQVIEGWVHNLGLTRIVIVSDRIKNDNDYKNILKISVPEEIKVDVFGIREMVANVDKGYLEEEDTLVLFENPGDVLGLMDYGVMIPSLNVGCLHYNGCNIQIRKNIAVSDEDIRTFEDINSMGARIESRALPQDKRVDMMELMSKIR